MLGAMIESAGHEFTNIAPKIKIGANHQSSVSSGTTTEYLAAADNPNGAVVRTLSLNAQGQSHAAQFLIDGLIIYEVRGDDDGPTNLAREGIIIPAGSSFSVTTTGGNHVNARVSWDVF